MKAIEIILLYTALLLQSPVVESWSPVSRTPAAPVPAPSPAAVAPGSPPPKASLAQTRQEKAFKSFRSFLISSSILICCQLSSLPHHHDANAATTSDAISTEREATVDFKEIPSLITSFESKLVPISKNNANSNVDIDLQQLEKSLAVPTYDHPQIQLPSDYNGKDNNPTNGNNKNSFSFNNQYNQNQNKNEPFLQGMVYLLNQNDRPDYSETIVLTVASAANPDLTIAGAKYSVSKARFPFQFRMYPANILDQQLMDRDINDDDLVVMARICPTMNESSTATSRVDDLKGVEVKSAVKKKKTSRIPCELDESTFLAKGISKVVKNLPGTTEGTVLRTAASLPLERRGGQ